MVGFDFKSIVGGLAVWLAVLGGCGNGSGNGSSLGTTLAKAVSAASAAVAAAAAALSVAPAQPAGQPPDPSVFDDPAIEALAQALDQDNAPGEACAQGLDALARSAALADERLQWLCRAGLTVAAAKPAGLDDRLRRAVGGELLTTLVLQAALGGDAPAWLGLSHQLAAAAGPADAPHAQLDGDSFAAAQAAAQQAIDLDVAGAAEQLQALQDREYPVAGFQREDLWRALYFRRYDSIADTLDNRRHVAGFALGIASICEQRAVSIRSVGFDAALETYLAPVRAQVPRRLLQAVPQMGRSLASAASQSRSGAGERSVEGWLAQGWRIVQAVKRDARNAVAIASTSGRDASQRLFNEAQSCRSRRGLKTIAALTGYLHYAGAQSLHDPPLDLPLGPQHPASALAAGSAGAAPPQPAMPAAAASAPQGLATLLADIGAGRLAQAGKGLAAAQATGQTTPAQQQRLRTLLQHRSALAAGLLQQAQADLAARRSLRAVQRLELAIDLDDTLAQPAAAPALHQARAHLGQARDAVARCATAQDSACLQRALRAARTLAPADPVTALVALKAADWYFPAQAGQAGPAAGLDGPPTGR